MRNELAATRNVTISSGTVKRRLNEAELDSRRPATAPLLTRENRVAGYILFEIIKIGLWMIENK